MPAPFTPFPNVFRPLDGIPDYLHPAFLARIDRESVRTIFEVGCMDGTDTLHLQRAFDGEIHAFECNPEILPKTRASIAGLDRVHLVERAAWDSECVLPFFPVTAAVELGKPVHNPGASSCFRARPDYDHAQYTQKETTVQAIRLDRYCAEQQITAIDLICIDAQGAELRALQGLGELIATVRYIVSEIEVLPIYYGQAVYTEIHAYLKSHGFRQAAEVYRNPWFSDFLYIRDASGGRAPRS